METTAEVNSNVAGVPSGNGAAQAETAAKEPSIISQIKAAWEKAGSKEPTAAQKKPVLDAWAQSNMEIDKAEAALEAAKAKNYAASEALAKLYGGRSLKIAGAIYDFASRGTKVFLRKKADKQTVVEV